MFEGAMSDDLSPTPEDPDVLSPSPSSAESFVTAYPSPGDSAIHVSRQNSSFNTVKGKSTSIDHFINVGSDDSSVLSQPNQGNLGPAFDPRNISSERSRSLLGRTRPPSVDSTGEGDGSVDSDFERSGSNERYRHTSLKSSSRPHIRGGELSLPSRALSSRTSTLNSTSSMSSTASRPANSGLTEISQQPLPPVESSISRPTETATWGRIQSGSGMFMNSRRDPSLDKLSSSTPTSPYTLIVAGTTGCGKSTVIRNGIRGRLQKTFARCSYWDGEVAYEGSTLPIRAIEINVSGVPIDPQDWLEDPMVNGVLICYDTSQKVSFSTVEGLLRYYHDLKLPAIVLACKADTQSEVDIYEAMKIAGQYGSELLPVTKSDENGLWKAFTWFRTSMGRDEWGKGTYRIQDSESQNPASTSILYNRQSRDSLRTTPKISSVEDNDQEVTKTAQKTPSSSHQSFMTLAVSSRPGGVSDEYEESAVTSRDSTPPASSRFSIPKKVEHDTIQVPDVVKDEVDTFIPQENKAKEMKEKESNAARPGQWATLDDLLNKLLFLAVSGDDPSYITHFLLTYRRFASPRSVVLKMQSRIRELDEKSSGDPMFACFAQMRICHLLEIWIRDYPYDFAVRGTASALSALITTIISKTHLLHYGSELLPFLETLPTLIDRDAAWAVKIDTADEIDDPYEDEEVHLSRDDSASPSPVQEQLDPIPSVTRERKSSFPLPSRLVIGLKQPDMELSEKQLIKDLLKVSQEIQALEPEEIAQEITRIEVKLFLDIKPRHWLAYTFVSGKKDGKDPISALNAVSNHLADWVVSLILCHKTPRARVKQIEKLVEIAQRLRALNNYSALRAFVAGINNATFPGDETMEQFKTKSPDQAKNLQSWDVLLQHIRAHRAYRLALRNSKGACIPALEVHMSDLIKAHEGNGDFNSSDTTKIHWGKFNMMGRFISSTAQCQAQCRTAADYNFTERNHIRELLLKPVMTLQMQKSRIAPIDIEIDDYRSTHPGSVPPRDVAILRKLIFW
ncbi:hypothetical protein C0993_003707 [Termitomyces sp. T159_Od127]|nr:hypothetical protein C0993_003707 [Termitomyces sp. T159_Od127]